MTDKIKQLSSQVANQISAGEVIERPASVVKELVENSLDADSTRIYVEVKDGGKKMIRVQDNGSGIKGEDLELAFSRYATSKIDNINDLYSLRSLGFRGEALSSIASVSEVKAVSRHKDSPGGYKLVIKGSKIKEKSPAPSQIGTEITVSDLFYNTPARFKYMKTTTTEFGHISKIITGEALAFPEVKFTLEHDNNTVLQTPGSGKLKDVIRSIYGRELTDNLHEIDFADEYITVRGFIAHPDYNRSSRIYEKFFVNRRVAANNMLSSAVEKAYGGLLARNKYPIVFLNISLNPILVDVNVHPAKKEVKFSRSKVIKNVIKKGIEKKLKKIVSAPQINIQNSTLADDNQEDRRENKKVKLDFENTEKASVFNKKNQDQNDLDDHEDRKYGIREEDDLSYGTDIKENRGSGSGGQSSDITAADSEYSSKDQKTMISSGIFPITDSDKQKKPQFRKVLGQIEDTYIIIEAVSGIYIIDQHAAEERIIFEKLNKKYNNGNISTQPLLVPVNMELTPEEIEILNKYDSELKELGFKFEDFGTQSIIVREVPVIIKKRSDQEVVKELIDYLLEHGQTMSPAEMISEIITYMSCRTAIKAGEKIKPVEQKRITEQLFAAENPYRCPHGRPAVLLLDDDKLAREFERK